MSDRLANALEGVVGALLPSLACFLEWEYRVLGVTPGPPVLISGEPVETSGQFACPFGQLANITLWPAADGGYALPQEGSIILIAFNDGNPAKPRVSHLDPNSVPTLTTLAGGGSGIAREGDTVTITQAEITAAGMVAGSNAVAISVPLQCKITSASTKAVCG